MPGNENKTMNIAENHARSAIISSTMSLQTTVTTTWKGINKIPKCFPFLHSTVYCVHVYVTHTCT